MERYLCIHGHFYQPPRENPWLEAIELQESAYPYHDWNERIANECYATNARSRILDADGRISSITNNYSRISFNFGPTLLSWMQHHQPDVYSAILDADLLSRERFGGHGSAIAQAYGHLILPLSNQRDKRSQVLWGIRDFQHRFQRAPAGMWLPETAADIPSLEALAEHGIRFTILAPRQAARIRPIGEQNWTSLDGEGIDPSMAYQQRLPSGREIALFFYDGPISQAVAFERLLDRGENFARRLLTAFDDSRAWPQLAHIATDGETYGHHHRHGEMALAYALEFIESSNLATITNYAQFLHLHPPTHQVEIHENSSWSCIHGVERWKSNCGCNTGMKAGWNQEWRAPLREALDWLRDQLAHRFESAAGDLLTDPWAARDDYISILLDRSPDSIAAFLDRHAARPLDEPARRRALKLLEMQRHAMLMFTSCGWFFDEVSGIETIQVIQYAGRAIQLARDSLGDDLEPEFIQRLGKARSNIREHRDGGRIYEKLSRPALVDLPKVAAHYAISSMFEDYPQDAAIHSFDAHREDARLLTAGRTRLLVGRARITSRITGDSTLFAYQVLHFGDHILHGAVHEFQGQEPYDRVVAAASQAFHKADFPALIRQMDKDFGASSYSLRSLFKDQQRRIVERVLESTLQGVEAGYRQVYEAHAPLLRFLSDMNTPPPAALRVPAEFVLNTSFRSAIAADPPDVRHAWSIVAEAESQSVAFDRITLGFVMKSSLERLAARLAADPLDVELLRLLDELAALADYLPFDTDLWRVQNAFYELVQNTLPDLRARAQTSDPQARQWLDLATALAEKLRVRIQ